MTAARLLNSRFVGWSAILSGVVDLVGTVFLILFFALEAPQILKCGEPSTPPLFGTLNDATFVLVALFLIPVALALHARERTQAPALSWITLAIGLASLLAIATTQVLYVPRLLSSVQQSPLLTTSLGTMGLWLLLANALAWRGGTLPTGLSGLGHGQGSVSRPQQPACHRWVCAADAGHRDRPAGLGDLNWPVSIARVGACALRPCTPH